MAFHSAVPFRQSSKGAVYVGMIVGRGCLCGLRSSEHGWIMENLLFRVCFPKPTMTAWLYCYYKSEWLKTHFKTPFFFLAAFVYDAYAGFSYTGVFRGEICILEFAL